MMLNNLKSKLASNTNSKRRNMTFFSPINNVALKYRYEKMRLSQIASVLCPNIDDKHLNLFEKINKASAHHLDTDIKVSQKILTNIKIQRISQGNHSYSPFIRKPKPIIIDFSAEIALKGTEMVSNHKEKLKKRKEMLSKGNYATYYEPHNTFDSVIDFENEINEENTSIASPLSQVSQSVNKKKSYRCRLQKRLKKQLQKEDLKVIVSPVIEKERIMTDHYLKMRSNFCKEDNMISQGDNESLSSKCLFHNKALSMITSPKVKYMGRNVHLAQLNSHSFFNSEDDDNNGKRQYIESKDKKKNNKGLYSCNTWAKSYNSSMNSTAAFHIKKKNGGCGWDSKEKNRGMIMKTFEELKILNKKHSERYRKDNETKRSMQLIKGVEELENANQRINHCIDKFDINFTQKLQKIREKVIKKGFSLRYLTKKPS